jgi:adenosylmethionine-8-amino-7-oxononanoate aminotransferase
MYRTWRSTVWNSYNEIRVALLTSHSLKRALTEQLDEVAYCHSLFYGTTATEELASLLIDSTEGEMARVFVISSGSEAMEAALKLTRQYHLEKKPSEPQRCHFIARNQSYHGTTLGALAAGGHLARRALYEPMLSKTNSRVSPCYAYRGKQAIIESDSSYVQRLEAELDAEFQRIGPQKVAAFIAEPVVGAALGCVPAVKGYFAAVRRVCDRYGALLIMDEIMSGCGRVGPEPTQRYPKPLHAWQDPLIGVTPDLMTIGKGLGGGYQPVAAVLANHKVVDVLFNGTGAFSHGQTYQGHPVACRAAVEVQRIIRDENLIDNVRKQGALLGKLLQEQIGSHWAVGDIRGKGLFWGIEFVADKAVKKPFEPSEAIAMGIHEFGMVFSSPKFTPLQY